jgi:ATP-binding protein involved in chromosome partitioning
MTDKTDLASQVMAQLGSVIEPELRRDLVTLNMIKDLKIEGDRASFTIMLTTPACPLKDEIERSAREAALKVEGINQVEIRLDSSVPTDRRIAGRLDLPLKSLIAVSSGKGGVGKSTIAANLAVALSQSGAAVGLMDADILGPNLPTMMGVHRMPPPENDRLIPAQAFGVKLMSMGFLIPPEQPLVWRGPMLHSAIRQFFTDVEWGPLDYMVVDLPPGTGDAQLTLAQSVPLSGAIIVTQPQNVAVDDALRSLAMFEKLDVPIIGVVENMSGDFFGSGGGQRLAEQRGVPFLGSVPLDPQVRIGGDSGRPIVLEAPDSPAAQALVKIASEVAARVSVLTLGRGDDVTPTG